MTDDAAKELLNHIICQVQANERNWEWVRDALEEGGINVTSSVQAFERGYDEKERLGRNLMRQNVILEVTNYLLSKES